MSSHRSGPLRTPSQAAATLFLDASGYIVSTNASVQHLLKRTDADLRGRDLLSLVGENAPYLGRLLTEPRWLDLGHDAIWSSATFACADGSPLECLVRVRRSASAHDGGFELRLEPHRVSTTPAPMQPAAAGPQELGTATGRGRVEIEPDPTP